jgi:biotin-dependent carboxylase-like uncharacterized protein
VSWLHVLRPGLSTTVQDLGRWGYQSIGVPVSGAMDTRSHRIANRLVGNPPDAATLETTLVGPSLVAEDGGWIAATGAACTIRVNGTELETPCAIRVSERASIDVGPCRRGARVYLAIAGGLHTPLVLGSRATDVRSGLGGIAGRALAAGDHVPIGSPTPDVRRPAREPPAASLPDHTGTTRLRVLPGPHAGYGFDRLCGSALRLTPRCDRVGYRFEGAPDSLRGPGDLLSIPTVTGAVQVTPSGEVILLMADRQTVGGYAQVAVLASVDLPLASQLTPGCRVSFVRCDEDAARGALEADERHYADWEAQIP